VISVLRQARIEGQAIHDVLIERFYDWKAQSKLIRRYKDARYTILSRIDSSRPAQFVMGSKLWLRAQWWWWDHVRQPATSHLGCYTYPDCDLAPQGCFYATKNPEPYGYRD